MSECQLRSGSQKLGDGLPSPVRLTLLRDASRSSRKTFPGCNVGKKL